MHVGPRIAPNGPLARITAPLAALVTAAAALSGCSILGHHPAIDTAADLLPSTTTTLVFTDREATADRLGVGDISGRDATAADVKRYQKALSDQGWGATQLSSYLNVMREGPFNELDIRWEASARWTRGDSTDSAILWRVDDNLDLGALGRSLTDHGYHKDTVSGLARYTIDFKAKADKATGLVGGLYPAAMTDVLLDSDDHLVVGAQSPQSLADIAAVTDGGDTLSDHPGDLHQLLEKSDQAEFAAMATGDGICQQVTPYGGTTPTQPDDLYTALGHPVARALVGSGDPVAATNYLLFGSSDDAAADATAREALIADGKEQRSDEPFSQLGEFTVSHDGSLVTIASDWATGPQAAVSAELTGGGPATCLPS